MEIESRNDEIEVLRATAILLVVFSHLRLLFSWRQFAPYEWINERFTTWVGVDLFFCISGFVIARSLTAKLDGVDRTHFWSEVIAFWIRRWYRIIPSAWTWVAILLVLTLAYNQTGVFGHFQSNAIQALSALLNIANFYFAECLRLGTASSNGDSPFGIYWSLSLEEQFYLALPILLALSRKWFVPLCVLLVLLQFFIERKLAGSLLWYVRTDAIFLGVLLAIACRSTVFSIFEPRGLTNRWLRWLVVALLLTALGAVPANRMVSFSTGFVALVSAALVFIASFARGYLLQAGYLRRVFVWIGSRSYAIYLIHLPVFLLVRETWNRLFSVVTPQNEVTALVFHAAGLVLVFALSELNYRILETPLRLRGRKVASEYLSKVLK